MDDFSDGIGRSGDMDKDPDASSEGEEERRKRKKEEKKKKRVKKRRSSTFIAADAAQDGGAVDGTATVRSGEGSRSSVSERRNGSSTSNRYVDEDQEGMRRRRHASSNEFRLHQYDVERTDTAEEDLFQENCSTQEGEGNGVGGMIEIPHDSFSMLYAASDFHDYVLPTGTFIVQVMILSLICTNLLQESESPSNNKMKVPVNVPLAVTISQYIACLVSIFTADDFITGMLYISKHIVIKDYTPMNNKELPPISRKWEISNGMRIFEGALVIFTSLVFIVQSSTVIDLFLNFAGVAFVSVLDDTSFFLARHDFFGGKANRLAHRVTDLRAYDSARGRMMERMRIGRYALFSCSTFVMWAVLSFYALQQTQLEFACKNVVVEVTDPRYASFRHYSGSYTQVKGKRISNRAVYLKDQGIDTYISYCKKQKRWIMQWPDVKGGPPVPCSNFSLMSERTRSFDISEVREFLFWTGATSGVGIWCADCNTKIESTCSYSGTCIEDTKMCDCKDYSFGLRCQHVGPCTELIMQDSFKGSKSASNQSYPKSFDLMYDENNSTVMWLNYPVYSQELTSRYIIYDGGRWNVIHNVDDTNTTALINYLDSYATDYDVLYVSEPSNLVTPANLAFQAQFSNEEGIWDREDDVVTDSTTVGRLGESQFYFSCADCIKDSLSQGIAYCIDSNGTANNDLCETVESDLHGEVNRCSCPDGFMGPLCQIRPAEGKLLLFVDQDGSRFCRVCGDGNDWSFWELDGLETTCIPFPPKPLTFQGTTGTFTRQLGLMLNETHFSVFVSGDSTARENNLCRPTASVQELYSSTRNSANEQIQHDYAIQLDNNETSFGKVIDPTGIDCPRKTNVDQIDCDAVSLMSVAWIQLDLKVTPHRLPRVNLHSR